MTKEEIKKLVLTAVEQMFGRLDPLSIQLLGKEWFEEFGAALAEYTEAVATVAYEEAAQVAEEYTDPRWNMNTAHHIVAGIRALKSPASPAEA